MCRGKADIVATRGIEAQTRVIRRPKSPIVDILACAVSLSSDVELLFALPADLGSLSIQKNR